MRNNTTTTEDIAKRIERLPKWAQEHIANLEREATETRLKFQDVMEGRVPRDAALVVTMPVRLPEGGAWERPVAIERFDIRFGSHASRWIGCRIERAARNELILNSYGAILNFSPRTDGSIRVSFEP